MEELKATRSGKYFLSQDEKNYLASFAKDGIISFSDYNRAMNDIINGYAPVANKGTKTPN